MRNTLACLGLLLAAPVLCPPSPLQAQNKDPYFIRHDEIAQHPDLKNAYDLILRIRPRFFRGTRASAGGAGASSTIPSTTTPDEQTRSDIKSEGILVVVNGSRRGNIFELRQIDTGTVESIRYIKGPDAMAVYGYEQAGVIEIVLTMGRPGPS